MKPIYKILIVIGLLIASNAQSQVVTEWVTYTSQPTDTFAVYGLADTTWHDLTTECTVTFKSGVMYVSFGGYVPPNKAIPHFCQIAKRSY